MGWLHAKLLLVAALSGYLGWLKVHLRRFTGGTNTGTSRFWRIANEVPAVVLLLVVPLAVLRPF